MNLTPRWTEVFESLGWMAMHWSAVGAVTAPDTEIMDWARKNGFCVFTHDLDFGILLAMLHLEGPSVIQIRSEDILPETAAKWLIPALSLNTEQIALGALVTIDPRRQRVRLLPITRPPE